MKKFPLILGLAMVMGILVVGVNLNGAAEKLDEMFAPLILRGDDSIYPAPGSAVNPYPYPAPGDNPAVEDPVKPTHPPAGSTATPTAYSNEPPMPATPTAKPRPTEIPPTRPAPSDDPQPTATPGGDWWCDQHPDDPRCQPPPPPTPFPTSEQP